jgi:ribonuclease HI
METAVVVRGRAYIEHDVGYGTSMDAEWLALIHALRVAQELELENFILLGDSASVVGQANGTQKCTGDNMRHLLAFRALLSDVNEPRVRYIKRAQNLAGIALARLHPR